MAEEDVEIVAELLAKVGGSWYPERTRPALRVINSRHREVARLILAALDRSKAAREEERSAYGAASENSGGTAYNFADGDRFYVGATVVYRPPGEKRAVTCRIDRMDHGRAYLVPSHREIGWVSTHTFLPLKS